MTEEASARDGVLCGRLVPACPEQTLRRETTKVICFLAAVVGVAGGGGHGELTAAIRTVTLTGGVTPLLVSTGHKAIGSLCGAEPGGWAPSTSDLDFMSGS